MKRLVVFLLFGVLINPGHVLFSQDVKSKNSISLDFSGRVQLQHMYDNQYSADDSVTQHGFRMRRVRLQTGAKVTSFLSAKVQIEVRDNSPRLKDAEANLSLFERYYLRLGQFKVPVWREEFIRSSGDLMLVERSIVAELLEDHLLSARHVGIELGGDFTERLSFALNYSNGAGEGVHEIGVFKFVKEGDPELLPDRDNGKLLCGRVDLALNKQIQIGISGALNMLGNKVDTLGAVLLDNTGNNTVLAPDFGFHLPSGIDIEGGMAFGKVSKHFLGTSEDENFLAADLTGRWKKFFAESDGNLGGLSGFEMAAGISYIDTGDSDLDKMYSYRVGPALYFGKKTRLQTNAEIIDSPMENEEVFWRIRSQFTVNF